MDEKASRSKYFDEIATILITERVERKQQTNEQVTVSFITRLGHLKKHRKISWQ